MKEILVKYTDGWYHDELIQCKECKYFDGEYCCNEDLDSCLETIGIDSGILFSPPKDFYCAYAKGKEE